MENKKLNKKINQEPNQEVNQEMNQEVNQEPNQKVNQKVNQEVNQELNDINQKLAELEDKYIRLYAEFENYKKRVQKEKEEIKNNIKISLISSILDMDNDISIAIKNIKDPETKTGVELIARKLENFLKSQGIEPIQTDTYDEELHEVVNVVQTGENKILDVVSKGYMLNGKPFRYPKIILSK